MKKNFFLSIPIFFALLLCPFFDGAHARATKITVATCATFPPMEMTGEDSETVGFDIDLIKAVAKHAGLKVRIVNTCWPDVLEGVSAGTYDAAICSVVITPERRRRFLFSEPYLEAGQRLVVRTGSGITCLKDMAGKKLATGAGSPGEYVARRSHIDDVRYYEDIERAFSALYKQKVDGIVCDRITAARIIRSFEPNDVSFQIIDKPLTEKYYGIVTHCRNQALIEKINKGIREVKKRGIALRLEREWLEQ